MGADGDIDIDDRAALRSLVEAYGFALDRRDGVRFVDLFSEDATLGVYDASGSATGAYVGRGELNDLPHRLERYDRTMHLVHNHEVQIDGNDASGEVYCTAHHIKGIGSGASDRVMTIRYLDRYRREPDRWRIRSREVRVQWLEERTVDR